MLGRTVPRRLLLWILAGGVGALLVLGALVALLLRPDALRAQAAAALSAELKLDASIDGLTLSFLPRPRISGSGLTLRLPNRPDLPAFLEIDRFWVDVGPFSALGRHVGTVHTDGLRIAVPPGNARASLRAPDAAGASVSRVMVDHVVAHDAVLKFVPHEAGKDALTFLIHDLSVDDVGFGRAMPFRARLTNPVPTGLVDATGTVGPWRADDPTSTPVAGTYTFTDADLSTINGIGGTLQSTGVFEGALTSIAVNGDAAVPDFNLDLGGRPASLAATFNAVVNGTDGTTRLERIDAKLHETSMVVSGTIANLAGPGRHQVDLEVDVTDGRVEDLVGLAVDESKPIMTGDVTLHTTLSLPPGKTRVRDRLRLNGRFGLEGARFTNAQAQTKLRDLSRRGQGKDEDEMGRVTTNFSGHFTLKGGVLSLPDLSFQVPGAGVKVAGTYALADGALDFRGTLRMDATVSKAVGGFKSIFIKPFDSIFKKNGAGAVVPIHITGTRKTPKVGVEMGKILKGGGRP
jgi:AsmA-like C-terminal region